MRQETFTLVEQALREGVVHCYGRGLLRTYLRVKFHRNAREDDVRDALAMLDAAGTESPRRGPNKRRQGPLSSVGAKGAESSVKDRQIRRPFHPDYYFLRKSAYCPIIAVFVFFSILYLLIPMSSL